MSIHLKRYNKLIQHYKNTIVEGFVEKHHINPKCMGGTDELSNLVALPPKAHFICHYLLHKAYPENNSLALAFSMMCVNNKFQNRKQTGKLYEMSKIARSSALRGKKLPESVKEKMRKPKPNKENYSYKKTKVHCQNISKALKKYKRTEEHHANVNASLEITRQNRSAKCKIKVENYRSLFIEENISRKQFAEKYNLSYSTAKKYLIGL